ncbi:hypothetical protein PAXRUDRAFT_823354 [Paxillus rubicundulus Ve08.2h10]|uniref:Uncharacterized protein n=1 Tax=Paxillus rubicundulus Ve08.2h10 TaxID=930991 RepID=A0A0D0EC84_9AGAM|nr:hypothetical protein PAXRUDRAFT_823354 [Paxillus rubicundulus Ve08.2h10]
MSFDADPVYCGNHRPYRRKQSDESNDGTPINEYRTSRMVFSYYNMPVDGVSSRLLRQTKKTVIKSSNVVSESVTAWYLRAIRVARELRVDYIRRRH